MMAQHKLAISSLLVPVFIHGLTTTSTNDHDSGQPASRTHRSHIHTHTHINYFRAVIIVVRRRQRRGCHHNKMPHVSIDRNVRRTFDSSTHFYERETTSVHGNFLQYNTSCWQMHIHTQIVHSKDQTHMPGALRARSLRTPHMQHTPPPCIQCDVFDLKYTSVGKPQRRHACCSGQHEITIFPIAVVGPISLSTTYMHLCSAPAKFVVVVVDVVSRGCTYITHMLAVRRKEAREISSLHCVLREVSDGPKRV